MIPRIAALALISVILSHLLKEFGFKSKSLFSTLCVIILIILGIEPLSQVLSKFTGLADAAGISDATKSAVRILGTGYVYGFTSDVCSSLGENDIASVVQMVGRLQIFLLALPFFEKTIALGMELLG